MNKPKKGERSDEPTPFLRGGWPELDKMVGDFQRYLTGLPTTPTQILFGGMPSDVVDEGDKFVIVSEMPGVSKEDIKLNLTEHSIEISADRKQDEEEKKRNYIRKERREISYRRTIQLPDKVDPTKSKAKLNNGVLTVDLPKITPTPKPRSTSIQVQ